MKVLLITLAILNIGTSLYFTSQMNKTKGWAAFWAFIAALLNAFVAASFIVISTEAN